MNSELVIAIAGNPNTGKTTLFNALTGSHQHTGNWPGVTVEQKYGFFYHGERSIKVVDLPGSYGFSSHSEDEKVTRNYLFSRETDLVVVVAEPLLLERHLYLAIQLLEMNFKVILCLNMVDVAEEKGVCADYERLGQILNIPVIPCVATKGRGVQELKNTILGLSDLPGHPFRAWYGRDVEEFLTRLENDLNEESLSYPARWAAIKYLEEDQDVIQKVHGLRNGDNLRRVYLEQALHLCRTLGYDDLPTLIAEKRYGYIHGLARECIRREKVISRIDWTRRIDSILTHGFVGMPLFFLILYLSFQMVFSLGNPLAHLLDSGLSLISNGTFHLMSGIGIPSMAGSFISHGVISGVGSVLVFLPNILILFFLISILEDSGYMARAAFIMDKVMHTMGLHGKSFVPMILGFGCNVPAVLATRILDSRKDRVLTILAIPLMSCSARLPIYILFTGIFFRRNQGLIVFSFYLIGVILSIVTARLFRHIFFRYDVAPLIMELPPYHLPSLKGALYHMWLRGKMFLRKAGTVIFAGVVIIWLLSSLPPGAGYASPDSIIGRIGVWIAPVFSWAGFGTYQAAIALISGVVAKEIVVGTMGTLYGDVSLHQAISASFTPLSAYAFMLMSLLYIPCVSTIIMISREIGLRWAFLTLVYTTLLGWILATAVYQIGSLII